MLSKKGWGSWLSVLVIVCLYGLIVRADATYWTTLAIGMTVALIPLWVTDRIALRIEKRKEIERRRKT